MQIKMTIANEFTADNAPALLLTDAHVMDVFDWESAAHALESVYALPGLEAGFPPRSMARGEGVWLRTLSGVLPGGGIMGSKQISVSIKSRKASYLISLFDQETSRLLCLMDAQSITGYRTAATSALAVKHLVTRPIGKVAVVGSGYEAKNHVRALAAMMPLGRIEVFSPREKSRQGFVDELSGTGLDLATVDAAEKAVQDADVVICAARSRDESPTVKGAWLRPGMTVVSIGSTLPEQRELDEEAIEKAGLIVADMPEEVADDTGDMLAARKANVAFESKLFSLSSLVRKEVARRNESDITLYKSVGAAVQDLAVALMCYRRAVERGLGVALLDSISPVSK